MAYIEKRQNASGISYRVRIRIQGMPQECATFPTRSLAKEWARIKESELKSACFFPQEEGRKKTFATFVDHYIEKILVKNAKSFEKQKQLMNWWRSKLGNYYLAHISPSLIADFLHF